MVKSMTGFGKITIENGNRKVVIEIKSLNSKTLDLNLKMPNLYKEKEMEIRNIVKEQLDRGKVEMCIYFDNTESDKDVTIIYILYQIVQQTTTPEITFPIGI